MASKKKPTIVDKSKELVVAAKKKKSAKDGLPCVVFLKGAEKGGILLAVRGKPIPKNEILEQRKPFKGGSLFKGVCYGVDGGIALDLFGDPDRQKLPEGPKLKKVINGFLETSYKTIRGTIVPLGQMGELAREFGDLGDEIDAVEGVTGAQGGSATPVDTEDQVPSDATVAPPLADLTEKFRGLQDQLKRVMENSPDYQGALKKAAMGVATQLKGGPAKAGVAEEALTKLQMVLAKLDTGTGGGLVDRVAVLSARSLWQDASDAIDKQLSQLQRHLQGSGDEELEEIAQFGFNALTGNFKAPLTAALMDVESASDSALPGASKKAHQIVVDFRKYIDDSEHIAACDDNPFEIKVSIQSTLGGALQKIERALAG